MTGRQIRKRGFTLVETVVTVGIIAALAAVVYPQVVRQFDQADPARIQNDLKNLQTAIEAFNVNVKAYPGDLDDLANQITVADSGLTTGSSAVFLSPTETGAWIGPYVDFSITDGTTDATRPTGFGVSLLDSFVCYDTGNDTHGISEGTDGAATPGTDEYKCPGSSGQKFLAIQIKGIVCSDANANFADLNELFDGTAESTNAETLGRVRCDAGGAGTADDIVFFLALPIS